MSTETQPGPDGICRGQEHYQHGGPARGHVGCAFHGTPAPAFPFVGARAQVTVAEYDYYGGGTGECSTVRAGDVVTLDHVGRSGNWRVTAPDGTSGHLVAARHLSPVPVSPGPDQPTEHEDWRVGKHYGIHVYGCRVVDYSGEDRPVATFHRPEDAARAVSDHQDAPALRAEVQRLTERVADRQLVIDKLSAMQKTAEAERDAARAELDAATTDGLGLPQVEVRRDGAVNVAWINGVEHIVTSVGQPAADLALDAAAFLALLRARLADETTTDDKEHDRG